MHALSRRGSRPDSMQILTFNLGYGNEISYVAHGLGNLVSRARAGHETSD